VTGGTVSHYDIVEILERGETTVYKARDHRDGALVALEVLPATRYAKTAETKERFRRESEIAAGLDHPHICPALEAGETSDGAVFVARSLEHGETLRSRIERGPLAPEHAVGLASQIAAALGRAHEQGIVHRDLRPDTILVAPGGQVRVSGFGLFWLLPQGGSCPASIVSYRSPELLSPAADAGNSVDARADIWSLGVLLYQMVTGRHPFRGGDRSALEAAILGRDPEPMTAVNPGLPAELQEIVARSLSKDPEGRPAHMDDLLVVLRGMLAGGGLTEVDSTVVQVPAGLRSPLPDAGDLSSPARGRKALADHMKGSAVSQYRILGLLGGGSMGTVYAAEDTRLRRTVALKFLPAELTRDPLAKARFFQEAQAASALDHPNICTIHEVGETGDGHLYLAMASYDGETVRTRLARGPMPLAEALEIARQTALGLAKAHRNGIVHRDIKPANLIVTVDGMVKILDFGVAKLRGPGGVNVAGSFLGTPAYMSPEQARGEEVDPRADVWSLGVVLYEMLAGVRPFKGGDDLTAVLRSLLEDRPEPLSRVRPEVAPELERIVARMLARAPAERYPSAAEVAADLAALQTLVSAAASGRRPRFLTIALAAIAGVAALAGIAAVAVAFLSLGGYLPRRPADPAADVLPQPVFTRLTDDEGRELYPSLSPDGRTFVYVKAVDGQMDIFFRRREDGSTPVNLTAGSPENDTQPAISPDGRSIAFQSERDGGGIFVMPVQGGPARRVSDVGFNPAWSPNSRELAVATEGIIDPGMRKSESEIWTLDTVSGLRRRLVADDGVQPSWSPHGWRIAYWGVPAGSARRILWTVSSEGGKPSKLLDDGSSNWNPVWSPGSPEGAWLYFGSDRSGSLNLWRLSIDERTGSARGKPEPVTTPAMASGFWSLSADGRRMIYAANESKSNVESFPFDPATLRVTGPGTAVTRGSNLVRSCSISPDGLQVAFHAALPREDLFVVGADGKGLRQLTDDAAKDRQPFWSPDGSRLLFYSNRGGHYEAWLLSLPDGVPERVLPEGREPASFPVWSPDGRRVACTLEAGPAIIEITEPLATRRPEPFASASILGESFYPTSWSGDGERIAGNISRLDRSIPEGIGVYLVSSRTYERWTSHGMNPVWLHDGTRLLYHEGGNILAFDTRTRETRQVLAHPSSSAYLSTSTGPGDRSLFVVRAVDEGDIWLLTRGGEK
jgi:serine/threonine protein kinase/Tol biopolymer transport system component